MRINLLDGRYPLNNIQEHIHTHARSGTTGRPKVDGEQVNKIEMVLLLIFCFWVGRGGGCSSNLKRAKEINPEPF